MNTRFLPHEVKSSGSSESVSRSFGLCDGLCDKLDPASFIQFVEIAAIAE
jgi:hypothetical protein